MAKSPEEMAAAMKQNTKAKTGKTLSQWLKILSAENFEKHGQIVKFLKSEHTVSHGFASMIAHESLNKDIPQPKPAFWVDQQYQGNKRTLRPIYDTLTQAVKKFGSDVEIAPKKTYVSFRRSKQFALVQPSTRDRIDVGIKLKSTNPTTRLEASGSFNAMVTHRVRVTNVSEIDQQLLNWLKAAYEIA